MNSYINCLSWHRTSSRVVDFHDHIILTNSKLRIGRYKFESHVAVQKLKLIGLQTYYCSCSVLPSPKCIKEIEKKITTMWSFLQNKEEDEGSIVLEINNPILKPLPKKVAPRKLSKVDMETFSGAFALSRLNKRLEYHLLFSFPKLDTAGVPYIYVVARGARVEYWCCWANLYRIWTCGAAYCAREIGEERKHLNSSDSCRYLQNTKSLQNRSRKRI